ncbi:MAG: hypothetical protein ACYSUI_20515 [Planctomycetota bacterium]
MVWPRERHVRLGYQQITHVHVSLWAPFVLFAAWPAIALICFVRGQLRRSRRRRKGLCLRCGYNLTGLPEPRCPECGAAI